MGAVRLYRTDAASVVIDIKVQFVLASVNFLYYLQRFKIFPFRHSLVQPFTNLFCFHSWYPRLLMSFFNIMDKLCRAFCLSHLQGT